MKVLLVPGNTDAGASASLLAARLTVAGIDAVVQPANDTVSSVVDPDELALVVPMGGDGTFLAAARLVEFADVPLLGLNYGRLGFLSGSPERDEVDLICDALSGELPFERRTTVDCTAIDASGGEHRFTALNEIAHTRGVSGHLVDYTYSVNGIKLSTLRADGLIVSTATGSTAYALSAGGPIVSPGYRGLLTLPVAPHTLKSRALVLAPSDVLELEIEGRDRAESSLFVDGVTAQALEYVSLSFVRGRREVVFARGGGDFFTNVAELFFK